MRKSDKPAYIAKHRKAGFTDEEIESMWEWDCKVDRGEQVLSDEEEAKFRKNLHEVNKIDAPKQKRTRTKKVDEKKQEIVKNLADSLTNLGATVNITNDQREFTAEIDGRMFKITVAEPRNK